MIIGKTPFIEELYKDYIIESYKKNYRFKLYGGRRGDPSFLNSLIFAKIRKKMTRSPKSQNPAFYKIQKIQSFIKMKIQSFIKIKVYKN